MKICFLTLLGATHVLEVAPGTTVKDVKQFLYNTNIVNSVDISLFGKGQNLSDSLVLDEVITPNSQVIINENTQQKKTETQKQKPKPKVLLDSDSEEDSDNMMDLVFSDSSEEYTSDDYYDDNFDDMIVDDIKQPIKKTRRKRVPPKDPENFDALVDQLVDLGFDKKDSIQALRKNDYNVDQAASILLAYQSEDDEAEKESIEEEDDDDSVEYDSEGESKRIHRFTMKRRDKLGELKPFYQSLTKEEQEAISDLVKETKQPRSTVIQIFIACDKDKATSYACLTSPM